MTEWRHACCRCRRASANEQIKHERSFSVPELVLDIDQWMRVTVGGEIDAVLKHYGPSARCQVPGTTQGGRESGRKIYICCMQISSGMVEEVKAMHVSLGS